MIACAPSTISRDGAPGWLRIAVASSLIALRHWPSSSCSPRQVAPLVLLGEQVLLRQPAVLASASPRCARRRGAARARGSPGANAAMRTRRARSRTRAVSARARPPGTARAAARAGRSVPGDPNARPRGRRAPLPPRPPPRRAAGAQARGGVAVKRRSGAFMELDSWRRAIVAWGPGVPIAPLPEQCRGRRWNSVRLERHSPETVPSRAGNFPDGPRCSRR